MLFNRITEEFKNIVNMRLLANMCLIVIICFVVPFADVLFYLFIAYHALKGPRQSIEAAFVLFLLVMGNSVFINPTTKALKWLVLFCIVITAVRFSGREIVSSLTPSRRLIILFMVVMVPLNLIFSTFPQISIFKIISLGLGAYALLTCFEQTASHQKYYLTITDTFFVFVIISSLFIMPFGYGYERNQTGFQGIFTHPQIMGPTAGVMAAYFFGRAFYGRYHQRLNFYLGIVSLIFVFLSQARTGLLMLGGGYILLLLTSGKALIINHLGIRYVSVVVGGILIAALAGIFDVQQFIESFLAKDEAKTHMTTAELFEDSRGDLMQASMKNFEDYPLFGIGFGVPSDGLDINIETVAGIPISARVEKGFMPTAVLEENGIFGTLIIVLILGAIIWQVTRSASPILRWMLFSILLINVGEASFFSIGGHGWFWWLMIGFILSQSTSPTKKISRPIKTFVPNS